VSRQASAASFPWPKPSHDLCAPFSGKENIMGMKDRRDWLRIVLAFVAVLLVAGPGLVLAGPSASYPYATRIVILGPRSVAAGSTNHYDVQVTLTDGTSFTVSSQSSGVTMTADTGSVSTSFDYTAPGSATTAHLMATYTSPEGKAVTGTRGVTVTP
jgi:phage-related tail fiber protein